MDLAPGTDIDRYVVERAIGRGGVAVVYLVRHRDLGTPAALKVLQVPLAFVAARLLHEGRIQGRLRHRNVVAVLDLVQVAGAPGLVVEYVPGPTLAQLLALRRPTVDEVDALARDVLAGMAAAHALGLVHRDLKPANVLVDPTGGALVAKVTDFGLARALDAPGDASRLTAVGAILGTPRYMAPEQVLDASSVDQRADVFSLGALLCELLTGAPAFGSRTVAQVLDRRDAPPPRLAGVPARMADAIAAALHPRPADRPPDASALLERWVAGSALAPDPWTPELRALAADPRWIASREPATPTSNPTWSEVRESSKIAPPSTAGPTRRPLRAIALGVGAALALVAWAAVTAPERPSALADDDPPRLADPALQPRLDVGWAALRAADTGRARAELGAAAAGSPDDAVAQLAYALACDLDGDLSASIEGVRAAVRAVGERDRGPGVALAGFLRESQASGTGLVSDGMLAWLDGHADWLGWLYAARYCSLSGEAVCERVEAGVRRVVVPSPVAALALARAWLELGRADRALAALDGVPRAARPEALRDAEADAAMVSGDFVRARGLYEAIRASGSSRADAAADALVVAARMTGDDGSAERWLAERAGPGRPIAQRAEVWASDAEALVGLGRFARALADLEAWAAAEAREGTPFGQVRAWSAVGRLNVIAGRYEREIDAVEAALEVAARQPAVPDPVRSRLASMRVYAEGRVAALAGDRAGLVEAQRILAEADQRQPVLLAGLGAAAGILDQDPAEVRRWLPELSGLSPCETAVTRAEALRNAGGGADPALDAALSTCAATGPDRAWAAIARVGRAELAWEAGDAAKAAAELAAYDALWPAPDADLGVVQRAEAVRAALLGTP